MMNEKKKQRLNNDAFIYGQAFIYRIFGLSIRLDPKRIITWQDGKPHTEKFIHKDKIKDIIEEKRFIERYEKERNVWCPHCGAKIPGDDESIIEIISYHGEHEPKEITCEKCEKTFFSNFQYLLLLNY